MAFKVAKACTICYSFYTPGNNGNYEYYSEYFFLFRIYANLSGVTKWVIGVRQSSCQQQKEQLVV